MHKTSNQISKNEHNGIALMRDKVNGLLRKPSTQHKTIDKYARSCDATQQRAGRVSEAVTLPGTHSEKVKL